MMIRVFKFCTPEPLHTEPKISGRRSAAEAKGQHGILKIYLWQILSKIVVLEAYVQRIQRRRD